MCDADLSILENEYWRDLLLVEEVLGARKARQAGSLVLLRLVAILKQSASGRLAKDLSAYHPPLRDVGDNPAKSAQSSSSRFTSSLPARALFFGKVAVRAVSVMATGSI